MKDFAGERIGAVKKIWQNLFRILLYINFYTL